MCFYKTNKQLYVTKRDILVYKYSTETINKHIFTADVYGFVYEKNRIYKKVSKFFKFINRKTLNGEVFHSMYQKLHVSAQNAYFKKNSSGYFLIPKGTLCYINDRDIVSRKIMYLGNNDIDSKLFKPFNSIKEDLNEITNFEAFFRNFFSK